MVSPYTKLKWATCQCWDPVFTRRQLHMGAKQVVLARRKGLIPVVNSLSKFRDGEFCEWRLPMPQTRYWLQGWSWEWSPLLLLLRNVVSREKSGGGGSRKSVTRTRTKVEPYLNDETEIKLLAKEMKYP